MYTALVKSLHWLRLTSAYAWDRHAYGCGLWAGAGARRHFEGAQPLPALGLQLGSAAAGNKGS